MAELRLFTAVRPPDHAVEVIARTAALLERTLGERAVRWVPRVNYHVTLEFLGATDERMVGAIGDAIRSVTDDVGAPMMLATGPVGAFPSAARPRTLWVGVDDPDDALAGVEAALRRRLRRLNVTMDEKPFRPHITVGYVRRHVRSAGQREIAAALRAVAHERVEFTVRELLLVSSETGPGGSVYTNLLSLPLGGE